MVNSSVVPLKRVRICVWPHLMLVLCIRRWQGLVVTNEHYPRQAVLYNIICPTIFLTQKPMPIHIKCIYIVAYVLNVAAYLIAIHVIE